MRTTARCFFMLAAAVMCAALWQPAVAAVYYVNASAAGDHGSGDAQHPFGTLAQAMKALHAGDTLNIAPGTYRETLKFPKVQWGDKQTVVQGTGPGVIINGSDVVTGWKALGSGRYVKQPWTVNSEQVFVDGKPLQQIGGTVFGGYPKKAGHPLNKLFHGHGGVWPGRIDGGLNDMTNNSFFYDADKKSLYIQVGLKSLQGHTIEASVRPYLVQGYGLSHVTLKNIDFQHANITSINWSGAVAMKGDHLLLDHLSVTDVDGNGADINGDDSIVRNSTFSRCGQVGLKVRGHRNKVLNNVISYNNTRDFNKWWEAGGAKFVGQGGLQDSEVAGNRVFDNNGDGIWFDWHNANNLIHDNISAYNKGFGIHYEASRGASIYNNTIFGNKQRGIYLNDSSHSVIAHNLVVANGLDGIKVIDDSRAKKHPEFKPDGNSVFGNIIAWNKKTAVTLPDDASNNRSDFNLFVHAGDPVTFKKGQGAGTPPTRHTLKSWQSKSGQDAHSWVEELHMPAATAQALKEKKTDLQWPELKKLASHHAVGAVPHESAPGAPQLDHKSPPGPSK
ncbi:MAG: right-handed parallel beta-helix repeat-containing protein [Burkholderiales bacterium]